MEPKPRVSITYCTPEAREVKQRVRDRVAPERNLGHSDRVTHPA